MLTIVSIRSRFALAGLAASLILGGALVAADRAEVLQPSAGKELPVRLIPNVPRNAEAYYGPDNLRVIAQTQDPAAHKAEGRDSGALTYTFTDLGTEIRRINDRGQDACSYFFPDGKRLVWTSTRDHLDMPIGNWSDQDNYPQGAVPRPRRGQGLITGIPSPWTCANAS